MDVEDVDVDMTCAMQRNRRNRGWGKICSFDWLNLPNVHRKSFFWHLTTSLSPSSNPSFFFCKFWGVWGSFKDVPGPAGCHGLTRKRYQGRTAIAIASFSVYVT